jgi:hypothetical protein
MTELRLRSRISEAEMEGKVGRILTAADFNVMLTGPTTIRKPDGRLLCVYVPDALVDLKEDAYKLLTTVRGATRNRGEAGGSTRVMGGPGGSVNTTRPVMSSILGAMDAGPRYVNCRLTSFTARETDTWEGTQPLWRRIADLFQLHVPDRYAAQADEAARTEADWVIPGTPFTTITVNNSYSTGVHKDKGDLDKGFSCLAVLRRGSYTGGNLVFPEYRVAVDMQDGDLMLMDSHAWHGNTAMVCACGEVLPGGGGRLPPEIAKQAPQGPCTVCGAERVSVVCYFRTRMTECGTPAAEAGKRIEQKELKF